MHVRNERIIEICKGKAAWQLGAKFSVFAAKIGLAQDGDFDPVGSDAEVSVFVDGYESMTMLVAGDTPTTPIEVDLAGAETLELVVDSLADGGADATVWADARLIPACQR